MRDFHDLNFLTNARNKVKPNLTIGNIFSYLPNGILPKEKMMKNMKTKADDNGYSYLKK
jgi:hypothetical protein